MNIIKPPYVPALLLALSETRLFPEILHCIALPLFPIMYLPAGFLGVTGNVQIISPTTYPEEATISTSSMYSNPNLCSVV